MKYYLWLNSEGRPVSKAWPYQDETERMAEEQRPPHGAKQLRTGTKEELQIRYGLAGDDFIEG